MSVTTALTDMSPRELVRGLMRGDRSSLKAGYSAANAVLAVEAVHPLDAVQRDALLDYAAGFAAAISHETVDPATGGAWLEGYRDGQQEHLPSLLPARSPRAERDAATPAMRTCGCGAQTERECAAAAEGYFTSLRQRTEADLRVLVDDGCEAARFILRTAR